jgi:16S rRNA (adenine1518-N6/adenine1519-N6)-dimethyltransferase
MIKRMDFVKTKKSLGQHWLHDELSLEAMCEMAGVQAGDTVIEIGPGLGTLTEKLLARAARVLAVEFDESLAADLPKRISSKDLSVTNEDILKFNFSEVEPGYKVVANIPYYLTSNLIRVLSETENPPISATLLIQKEVAERLCASPGSMSLLSVSAQMYFICSMGPIVPARLFTPPPKVDSQIVHLGHRETPLFSGLDERTVFRVVKAGFSNRRKTLHNSLAAGLQISKDQAKAVLDAAGINPQARPQELSLEQWLSLVQATNN